MTAEIVRPDTARSNGSEHDAVDAAAFKALFRRHPAGVAVVTFADSTAGGSRPVGFTATSVISVSASPAVLAFVVASASSSWPGLSRAGTAVVNLLAHSHSDLSTRFATPGIDRFAGVDWEDLPSGEPHLLGAASWARVAIAERHPAGDSFLVVAPVIEVHASSDHDPLVFLDRRYHRLGEHGHP
ncbi:flavin reductase domain protein FMN-binding [Beutenbergia cavernae DSM 12333]|uniref:Flavin reductase domain protein FMN-binding n=1 Tax=Beutenbergia cavernae (strain ATCC BAA-8 / DSM 12333 / CCUG 43141 / JCM 11478 / NBRC 16432 / NCIMB 13614 / HKI 0122) TaxID=471853 RepID=C5BVU8_BEUC1|nr:flavin reductase family protein [Beutenbergia cavernae]ACQ80549.1 flavin reductase domain protein FMN-binding [Beutenbergia cavernae DSM 12333]